MAFYFFFGTIPLFVVMSLLVGSFVQAEGVEELAAPLYRAMPAAASELLRRELYAMRETDARAVAPLSILGFMWLTTNGVHNLMDVFELLVGARPRGWLKQRLIASVWVAGGIVAVAATTWTLLALNGVARFSAAHVPALMRNATEFLSAGWNRFGVFAVFTAISSCALALFYRTSVRHPPGVRRRVWIGTFVALAIWALVSWAFGRYVQTIADYAVFYGGLATVAVTLLWLYLTSLALLVGAEVNAVLEGMRDDGIPPGADG